MKCVNLLATKCACFGYQIQTSSLCYVRRMFEHCNFTVMVSAEWDDRDVITDMYPWCDRHITCLLGFYTLSIGWYSALSNGCFRLLWLSHGYDSAVIL